ncbi:hypothetical protein QYE76_008384 [Lolium multiflorum]|uniref:Uncharacterized protein n=1 Tax=Lolium multiflorum TaxID=4521 RepID=A0AAD8QFT5_LOLMU|nr:hypothetical protein QYE76_008384 [Lolium multiflorum]
MGFAAAASREGFPYRDSYMGVRDGGFKQAKGRSCDSDRKSIFQGYGARLDKRDLSLHDGFKDELHTSLGSTDRLPQAFVDGKHVGSADYVRRKQEARELSKELDACSAVGHCQLSSAPKTTPRWRPSGGVFGLRQRVFHAMRGVLRQLQGVWVSAALSRV